MVALFKVPKKSKEEKLAKLSPALRDRLAEIEGDAITDFHGDFNELEAALGMLRMGPHVGWKVLYLIHSKKTIRKYEQILTGSSKAPVLIRDLFEPTGPSSYRSFGFRAVESLSNFWKAVSGDVKIADRRKIEK